MGRRYYPRPILLPGYFPLKHFQCDAREELPEVIGADDFWGYSEAIAEPVKLYSQHVTITC